MKKMITTALALVLTLGMSVTAFAAPSKEVSAPTVEAATDASGATVTVDVSQPVPEAAQNTVNEEAKKLVSAESVVLGVLNVVPSVKPTKENPVTLTFTVSDTLVTVGETVTVLHYNGSAWDVVEVTTVKEGGKVSATFTDLSPVAIVKGAPAQAAAKVENTYNPGQYDVYLANQSAPAANGVTSPKTGEAGTFGLMLVIVACSAAFVCVSRKKTA